MTTRRIVKKGASTTIRGSGVTPLVAEYQQVRKMKAMWEKQEAELKKRLLKVLEDQGEPDDKDHLWFKLTEEANGVNQICRQKRVSQIFQEETVERELKRLDLWDECTTQITVIDEDVVLAKAFEKEIPEEVMETFYEEKITYALVLK